MQAVRPFTPHGALGGSRNQHRLTSEHSLIRKYDDTRYAPQLRHTSLLPAFLFLRFSDETVEYRAVLFMT